MKRKIIALTMAILLSLCMLAGCGKKTESASVYVQPVTAVAEVGGLGAANRFGGTIVAQKTVDVSKDSSMKVDQINVEVGQSVKKGDVLFTYNADEIQMSLDKMKIEKEQLEDTITNAKSQIAELQKERDAASSTNKLQYNVEIQSQQIAQTEAEYNLKTKENQIAKTQATLDNTSVTSPVDGIVQTINKDQTDASASDSSSSSSGTSSGTTAFMTIMETGMFRVKGTLTEADQGVFTAGTAVIVRSRVDETKTWSGSVASVDWGSPISSNSSSGYATSSGASSSSTSSYPFYVTLNSADGLILGQHVYIEADNGQTNQRDGIWLPSSFIGDAAGSPWVWAADSNNKLEKRSVTLGEHDEKNDLYEVKSGLTITDYIASPNESMKAGMAVTKYAQTNTGAVSENSSAENQLSTETQSATNSGGTVAESGAAEVG